MTKIEVGKTYKFSVSTLDTGMTTLHNDTFMKRISGKVPVYLEYYSTYLHLSVNIRNHKKMNEEINYIIGKVKSINNLTLYVDLILEDDENLRFFND
jgi:hypothetical protein